MAVQDVGRERKKILISTSHNFGYFEIMFCHDVIAATLLSSNIDGYN